MRRLLFACVALVTSLCLVAGRRVTAQTSPALWAASSGGNGNSYVYVATPMTWDQAKASAAQAGGHLVTITSAAENAFVAALVPASSNAWIGGSQPAGPSRVEPAGGWVWVTPEPFSYANWTNISCCREPNNAGSGIDILGHEDHLAMSTVPDRAGSWFDISGGARFGFVVEYEAPSCAITVLDPFGGPNYTASAALPAALQQLQTQYGDATGLGALLYESTHDPAGPQVPNPYWVDLYGPSTDSILVEKQADLHLRIGFLQNVLGSVDIALNADLPPASAFRPLLYQAHFWNVRKVSQDLLDVLFSWNAVIGGVAEAVGQMPDATTCSTVADAVNMEQSWHGFVRLSDTDGNPLPPFQFEIPGGGSISVPLIGPVCHPTATTTCSHTTGIAVDAPFAPFNQTSATIVDYVTSSDQPGVWRRYGNSDKYHFEVFSQAVTSLLPMQIVFNSPIRGLVTDPQGRHIGFEPSTLRTVNEIGDEARYSGIFSEPQFIDIDSPLPGIYRIDGIGTGPGLYRIFLASGNEEGNQSRLLAAGTVTPGQPIESVELTLSEDSLPPSTVAAIDPVPNGSGWNNANLVVLLKAGDDLGGSGVSDISYTVVGAETVQKTTVHGASVVVPISTEGTSQITFFARDVAGNTEAPRTVSVRLDKTAPVIAKVPDLIFQQTFGGGATVTYSQPPVIDAGSGLASSACGPASGSTLPVGITFVTCVAADLAGNTSSTSFSVTVSPGADGRMFGAGYLEQGGEHHHFELRLAQITNKDYGRFEYWVGDSRRCFRSDDDYDRDHDGDHDHNYGRDHRDPVGRFVAKSIDSVVFSDDPAFRPGRARRPTADTVWFSGAGNWNGRAGYTFEALATDQGEPGRHRDSFSLVVKDSHGHVVANVTGALDGGNIQSSRLGR